METGKSLPPYDLPDDDDGCRLVAAAGASHPARAVLSFLLLLVLGKRRWCRPR